jgi:hypothetical protein
MRWANTPGVPVFSTIFDDFFVLKLFLISLLLNYVFHVLYFFIIFLDFFLIYFFYISKRKTL